MLLSIRASGVKRIDSQAGMIKGNNLGARVPKTVDKAQKTIDVEILQPVTNLEVPQDNSQGSSSPTTILEETELSVNSMSKSETRGTIEASWDVSIVREPYVREDHAPLKKSISSEKDFHKAPSLDKDKDTLERHRISVERTASYSKVLRRMDDMYLNTSSWHPGLTLDFSEGTIGLNFSDGLALTADEKDDEEERFESTESSCPPSSDGLKVNPEMITDLNCTVVRRLPPDATLSFDTPPRWEQGTENTSSSKTNLLDLFHKETGDDSETKILDEDFNIEILEMNNDV